MDVTPRRYRTDSISYRGVITPRHKYPRYVHSILAGRSRDILHTVTWNVKTETSSYLRDVFGHKQPSLRWMEPCGTSNRDITPRCHWIHVSLGLILSLTRSFFEEIEMDDYGNVIQCRMCDLMHDLAKSVVRSFITTLDANNINFDGKTGHVSFVGDCKAINSSISISISLCKATRIRTFLCVDLHYNAKIDCDAIFSSFKFLRMLDLSYRKLYCVPSSIERYLKH
jgi:hypothetical protein